MYGKPSVLLLWGPTDTRVSVFIGEPGSRQHQNPRGTRAFFFRDWPGVVSVLIGKRTVGLSSTAARVGRETGPATEAKTSGGYLGSLQRDCSVCSNKAWTSLRERDN